jgi:hypothetical protein
LLRPRRCPARKRGDHCRRCDGEHEEARVDQTRREPEPLNKREDEERCAEPARESQDQGDGTRARDSAFLLGRH